MGIMPFDQPPFLAAEVFCATCEQGKYADRMEKIIQACNKKEMVNCNRKQHNERMISGIPQLQLFQI